MRAIIFDNPDDFAQRVTPFLMKREAERNWFLGMLHRLPEIPDAVMCAVEDESGAIVQVALMTPPWQMGTSSAPAGAAEALADELMRRGIAVPGIQGDVAATDAFATHSARSRPVHLRRVGGMGIYQLKRVIPPARASGAWRVASMDDFELLLEWNEAFGIECDLPRHHNDRALTERAIAEERRFIWCDPAPVCMTGTAGPTPNGMRIQAVYTPPGRRGRGYASNLVATVSQRLLDSGRKFCFLFTDLANPTSNKIYQALGYRHVADSQHIAFDSTA